MYHRRVYEPKSDPFSEQLKADVLEGLEDAKRGELIPADEVWTHLDATISEIERDQQR